jgi:hypothetical protein
VTEKSVRRKYRLVAVSVEEVKHETVTSIVVEQEAVGRLLVFGDMKCDTAGTAFTGVLFRSVKKPLEVKEVIEGAMGRRLAAQNHSGSKA